jgi:hypothetical protein
MDDRRRSLALIAFILAGGVLGLTCALLGSPLTGLVAGLMVFALGLGLALARTRPADGSAKDPTRRRFLALTGAGGLALAVGGPVLGRFARQLSRPDPMPLQESMAQGLGAEYTEILRRTFRPARSGDIQLLLAPFNSSNYAPESRSLVPLDPSTSHASVWMYLERIPLVVHAPGRVAARTDGTRVSLADIAPTIAAISGFTEFLAEGRDGAPLPGIPSPVPPDVAAPKVIVTFVFDGGGWNVLDTWPDATPNLRALMKMGATYTNAIHGSFPAVTACAHATIGTGSFPSVHGVTGHNIRDETGAVRKAYRQPGHADPRDILIPTLADLWSEKTGNRAWVGELGYQVWHLGMLGRGGQSRTAAQKPVAVFWDEDMQLGKVQAWQPQNPDLYRMPAGAPSLEALAAHQADFTWPEIDRQFDPKGHQMVCCSPPIIRYMGDLVEATVRNEPLGQSGVTDLLFINYKMPDYTGHIYNMLSEWERIVLEECDAQLGRLVADLDRLFPNDYALIVTADHGQCPLPDAVNGVRLDPIQLESDINREFGGTLFPIVEYVAPSEIYLHSERLWQVGATADDVAVWLRNYRYRSNIGPYVPANAIEQDLLNQPEFAAVFGKGFLTQLASKSTATYGETSFPDGELRGFSNKINPYGTG